MTIREVKKTKNIIKQSVKSKKVKKHESTTNKPPDVPEKKIPIIPFKDLEGKFLHVRVGDNKDIRWLDSDFSNVEVKKVEDRFIDLLNENEINCLVFVTHHAVEIQIIESKKEDVLESKNNAE